MEDSVKFIEISLLLLTEITKRYILKKEFKRKIESNNYKIYKQGLDDGILLYSNFPKRTIDDILYYEEIFGTNISEELKDIFNKFINYVDYQNIEYCLVNLSSLKIDKRKNIKEILFDFAKLSLTSGYYDTKDNKITIIFNNKNVLSHEFLHMASTSYFDHRLCGFHIITDFYDDMTSRDMGVGLNEGYTELLNSRIFSSNKKSNAYKLNVEIAKLIECFFDSPKEMEYAYFHSNISAVYDAICKYSNREEFFYIIKTLDSLTRYFVPTDIKEYYQLKLKLHEIIKRSKDGEKIEKFEKVLSKNSYR